MVKFRLRVRVADVISNKILAFEVDPETTLKELIDAVVEHLKLPTDYTYSIVYETRELGPEYYNMTLREIGIKDGDELQLLGRPVGG